LWLGNSGEISDRMKNKKMNSLTESDFFVSEVLKQRIENFSPDDLVRNEHGKPELTQSNFSFNLSHCGENFALVLCDQKFCGIDIQAAESKSKFNDALGSVLTDSEYSLLNEIGRDDDFFRLWSLKEAYIKAIGSSIWFGRDYDFSSIIPDYSDKWIYSNNLYLFSTEMYRRVFLSIAVPLQPAGLDFKKL
jgi:phosphopantetheinyl transferase